MQQDTLFLGERSGRSPKTAGELAQRVSRLGYRTVPQETASGSERVGRIHTPAPGDCGQRRRALAVIVRPVRDEPEAEGSAWRRGAAARILKQAATSVVAALNLQVKLVAGSKLLPPQPPEWGGEMGSSEAEVRGSSCCSVFLPNHPQGG
jgi:hypothetical protein